MEFEEVKEAELTANAIAQSMCDQCEPDGNQYLMLDYIVDFCRNTTALCYADQIFLRTDDLTSADRPKAGNYAENGRTEALRGRS